MKNFALPPALLLCFFVASCSNYSLDRVEKRHYRPGWYVQFSGKPKTYPVHYPGSDPTPAQFGLGTFARPAVQKSKPADPPKTIDQPQNVSTISAPPQQQQTVTKTSAVTTTSPTQKVSSSKNPAPKKHIAVTTGNKPAVTQKPKPVSNVNKSKPKPVAQTVQPKVIQSPPPNTNTNINTNIIIQQQAPSSSGNANDIQGNPPLRTNNNNNLQQAPSRAIPNSNVRPHYEGNVNGRIQSK